MSKPKPVNWELIEDNSLGGAELYAFVYDLIKKYHQGNAEADLMNLSVVLMWRHNVKPDKDGYILLSDVTKSSDKARELRPHDVIIGLNKHAWELLDDAQKSVVVDSQLERIAVCLDKDDNPKEDDQSRPIYRLRRNEVLDDQTMLRRHGKTVAEVRQFVFDKLNEGQAEKNSYVDNQIKE